MKRGILILAILFILPFVNAVPTFNLFDGNVLCGNDVQTGYSISVNVSNGTNLFEVPGSVSSAGEYVIVVGAANDYNISFYVDDVFVEEVIYNESLIDVNNDLVLESSHALCYVAPPGPNTPNSPSSPSGPSGPSTPSGDDNESDDNETDVVVGSWDVTGDGTQIDITSQAGEVISAGGEYVLVIDGVPYGFSVYAVNSENAKIWIDDIEYDILVNANVELNVGGRSVLASYLETQEGLARLSFQGAGVRATEAFSVMTLVYLILGIIIISVGIFFLIRKFSSSKPVFKNKDSDDAGLLAGPKK